MKKLHLHLDQLAVESFATNDAATSRGTVAAHETEGDGCATIDADQCAYTPATCACEQTALATTCRATGLQCCEQDPSNGTGPICCNETNGTGSLCCP
jgi:hypothetical protein